MGKYLFLKFYIIIIYEFIMCECLLCVCRSWFDNSFDGIGHHRQVNQVLGNMFRLHWLGLVTNPATGELILITQ